MLISSVKLLSRFNSTSLYEEVSHSNMNIYGTDTFPIILSDGNGYQMQNDQYLLGDGVLSSGYSLDVAHGFTIGFWLYPVCPGLAINEATGDISSIVMPLLDFTDIGSALISVIKLEENTTENGTNYLTVYLNNGDYQTSSEEYAPNLWHFFLIVYDGSNIYIYIDGKMNTLQETSGTLPSSLDDSILNLYINHRKEGYAYNIAKNYGYINDLFVFNTSNMSEKEIQKIINDGVDYVVNDLYVDLNIEKCGVIFNDPYTITVNTAIDDMSYIYLGRNDGKILRGSPLLWESRRVFSNDGELSVSELNKSTVENGFLKLQNENIRL